MKEKITKLKTGVVEIQREVTNTEVFTVNPEVLEQDIKNAEAVIVQRKSELASAETSLKIFKDLKIKISKVK